MATVPGDGELREAADIVRPKLLAMRGELIRALAQQIAAGDLALLGSVHLALQALDAAPAEAR
jgi:hypothetical protein